MWTPRWWPSKLFPLGCMNSLVLALETTTNPPARQGPTVKIGQSFHSLALISWNWNFITWFVAVLLSGKSQPGSLGFSQMSKSPCFLALGKSILFLPWNSDPIMCLLCTIVLLGGQKTLFHWMKWLGCPLRLGVRRRVFWYWIMQPPEMQPLCSVGPPQPTLSLLLYAYVTLSLFSIAAWEGESG